MHNSTLYLQELCIIELYVLHMYIHTSTYLHIVYVVEAITLERGVTLSVDLLLFGFVFFAFEYRGI